MASARALAVTGLLLAGLCRPVAAQEPASTLGIGANYLGGQLDYRFDPAWRMELRFLTGRADSDSGRVTSRVAGLRGYRSFRIGRAYQPYLGAEADYVSASTAGSGFKSSGASVGGFAGLERRLLGPLWAGADAGPYVFYMKEQSAAVSQTSVEFIVNAYVMVYLF